MINIPINVGFNVGELPVGFVSIDEGLEFDITAMAITFSFVTVDGVKKVIGAGLVPFRQVPHTQERIDQLKNSAKLDTADVAAEGSRRG